MAWRPAEYLIEGILDNSRPGKVMGWMKFAGLKGKVTFDLEGDFHRDIRGAKIRFIGDDSQNDMDAVGYMQGFARHQTGKAGDMTAGLEPRDYVSYPYVEWYSDQNGRVVLELEPEQIEVVGMPIPACESDPVSREQQNRNMAEFLGGLAAELNIPPEHAICVGGETVVKADKRATNSKVRGMKLLPYRIRERLPGLGGQDGRSGKAVAYAKCFSADGPSAWYITEGSPVRDKDNFVVDYALFGLVEGQSKGLGFFMLSDLETIRGPMGLPIERDLRWEPKTLEEIAPEMFKTDKNGGD